MLYIHRATCISPQQTFPEVDIEHLHIAADNKLKAIEPKYEGIPPGILRRMGKAVRIGVGAALPMLHHQQAPHGIIIGSANGGMEDCIKFLNQIIEYEEGMLTPGNFVQSTPNAIASQISLLSSNKTYNITHVHRGLAFENALIDAVMQVKEHPAQHYIVGAVDEISTYNYNIDFLGGWYKKEPVSNIDLYTTNSAASIAGEGAAMFWVNSHPAAALARVQAIDTLHSGNEEMVRQQIQKFISKQLLPGEKIDLLITGENGDNRLLKYYTAAETIAGNQVPVARYKHMCGEYPTSSAVALWLACIALQRINLPAHVFKQAPAHQDFNKILIYNNYKGAQHSLMLVSKA